MNHLNMLEKSLEFSSIGRSGIVFGGVWPLQGETAMSIKCRKSGFQCGAKNYFCFFVSSVFFSLRMP